MPPTRARTSTSREPTVRAVYVSSSGTALSPTVCTATSGGGGAGGAACLSQAASRHSVAAPARAGLTKRSIDILDTLDMDSPVRFIGNLQQFLHDLLALLLRERGDAQRFAHHQSVHRESDDRRARKIRVRRGQLGGV